MSSVLILLAVVAVVAVVSVLLRRSEGRVRRIDEAVTHDELVDLGLDPHRWSLVEFTAPGCAPCLTARTVLDEVAADSDADVISVDVAEHLGAARHHHVLRAPTTLVIAPGGHVRARVTGVPRAGELREAVRAGADQHAVAP